MQNQGTSSSMLKTFIGILLLLNKHPFYTILSLFQHCPFTLYDVLQAWGTDQVMFVQLIVQNLKVIY